jgi:hypothetical protein
VVMHKKTLGLTAALLLIAVLVALFAAGCGTAATTPQDILTAAMNANNKMEGGSGTFDMSITVNGDPTKMPAETKDMLSKPITLKGTVAASSKPTLAADMSVTINLAGQELPLGIKILDKKAWMSFMGQWYEMPAEVTQALATSTSLDAKTTSDSLMKLLKDAGIDPMTWITGLQNVGEEKVGDIKAYHLTGTIDFAKLMADVMKIASDKNLQSKLPGASALGSTGTSLAMPDATELAKVQSEITSMFQNTKVDMWISKADSHMLKGSFSSKIVPPAEASTEGITDITLTASFTVTPSSEAVKVVAPTDAKPFTEMEKALGGLEQMFGGALGGTTLPGSTDSSTDSSTDVSTVE